MSSPVLRGVGVKRRESGADTTTATAPNTAAASPLMTRWIDAPSFHDQARRFPNTVRLGPAQFAMFNTFTPDGVDALNKFMEQTHPPDAPAIAILHQDEKFAAEKGGWLVLIKYARAFYVELVPVENKTSEETPK